MDYNNLIEYFEAIRGMSVRCIEIITDDEFNKDNKLKLRTEEISKKLEDLKQEINNQEVKKRRGRRLIIASSSFLISNNTV